MTTNHPCMGLTKSQIEAFEAIAINEQPKCSQKTLDILEKGDLIKRIGDREVGRDALGPINVPVYEVTLHAHMQWCQWAAEQSDDDEV